MRARGFSLVELLVALVIGSFLIVGAVTLYVRSSAAYAVNETLAGLQETARFALATLEPDIQMAGYWGLTGGGSRMRGSTRNLPLALSARATHCGDGFALDLHRPADGTNNSYGLPCAASGGGAAADTDMLITRHAEPVQSTASSERLQIYTTRAGTGHTVFLSDTPPGPIGLDPALGASAEIHDLSVRAYYIARSSTGQTGLPALRRKVLQGGPSVGPSLGDEEIMPGVEDLQIRFGIDPGADDDGDGVPDDRNADGQPDRYNGIAARYVDPGDPALETSVVVAVRLWLRVRAETPEAEYADTKAYSYADTSFIPAGADAAYRRLLVSRTIQLRNAGNQIP